jgi:hypothetical protein
VTGYGGKTKSFDHFGLLAIEPPSLFVVVAGAWPGGLVSLISLGLPVLEAYFPARFQGCFKGSKDCVINWTSILSFHGPSQGHHDSIFVVSGNSSFLQRILPTFRTSGRLIVTVDFERGAASRPALKRATADGHAVLLEHGLRPLVISDAATGGATDAQFVIGLGSDLSSLSMPVVEIGLQRTIRHIIDGGVEGRFPSVLREAIPLASDNPPRAVLWHNEILRAEGLYPCRIPNAKVYCPSYRMPKRWVIRQLTIREKLRLFQLPLSMDESLGGSNSVGQLPFADSPSPEIYTSLFRQLWGVSGGGVGT